MKSKTLTPMQNAVAYYRVSTQRQGRSGLGLEAQNEAVHSFIKTRQLTLIREFTEIESGKKSKRPILTEALQYCKKNKMILLIAKLDRLGRNVAFISSLMETKVYFIAVDIPDASPVMLHMYAVFAEHESVQISIRTKEALAAAKNRGVQLGKFGKTLAERNSHAARDFALHIEPLILTLKKEGFPTIEAVTKEMNKRKIPPYRAGSKWHISTVHRLLKRLGINLKQLA
jgi:DNA invertase Pin-like site-specific DNA recombinase